ncbi:MAG: heme NO-binding domain-containing protein [Myxococcota bacterium]
MKGVVFNLLEAFVVEGWGEETYERLISKCPLKTKEPFVGPGTYPDSDLLVIANAAARTLGISLDDALVAFGAYCFPKLAATLPAGLEGYDSAKGFLLDVDRVIHVEVRKLLPEAKTPKFTYEDPSPDQLYIRYESERKLCRFMEGLLDGVAAYFQIKIDHEQTCCVHQGAPHCLFALRFQGGDAG